MSEENMRIRTTVKVPNGHKFPPEIHHDINSQSDKEQDNYEILGGIRAPE